MANGKRGAPKGTRPPNAGIGRAKGVPNKATANAREAIARFVDEKSALFEELLTEIRRDQGALATWKCIMDLIEYHVPKLARTEVTGANGGPMETRQISDLELARRVLFDLEKAEREKPGVK